MPGDGGYVSVPTPEPEIVPLVLAAAAFLAPPDWKQDYGTRKRCCRSTFLHQWVLEPIWAAIDTSTPVHDLSGCEALLRDIFASGGHEYWSTIFKTPLGAITEVRPEFFDDEADPNHCDQPRLDILAILVDGGFIRYHPGAFMIASWHPPHDKAIQGRRNRRYKVGLTYHR